MAVEATRLSIPPMMTLEEFLVWEPLLGVRWQLVDGMRRAMMPVTRTHGILQTEVGRLLANHLIDRRSPCSVIANPGVVPRIQAGINLRIPDLLVTGSLLEREEYPVTDPILVIEILSPNNRSETWSNVWTYTTIPSVREILIIRSTEIGAELLSRDAAGNWPENAVSIPDGILELQSIGFRIDIAEIYRETRLASG